MVWVSWSIQARPSAARGPASAALGMVLAGHVPTHALPLTDQPVGPAPGGPLQLPLDTKCSARVTGKACTTKAPRAGRPGSPPPSAAAHQLRLRLFKEPRAGPT